MKFGYLIKHARREKHYTQDQLAEKLFVTRQTVSNWENNLNYPSLDLIIKISDLLDIPTDQLLREDNAMAVKTITNEIEKGSRYKKKYFFLGSILIGLAAIIAIFVYGYRNQIDMIDRFNPTLQYETSVARMPEKVPTKKETFINVNKDDEETGTSTFHMAQPITVNVVNGIGIQSKHQKLTFYTGVNPASHKEYRQGKSNYVLVYHKGSYVSATQIVDKADVPTYIAKNIDETAVPVAHK